MRGDNQQVMKGVGSGRGGNTFVEGYFSHRKSIHIFIKYLSVNAEYTSFIRMSVLSFVSTFTRFNQSITVTVGC